MKGKKLRFGKGFITGAMTIAITTIGFPLIAPADQPDPENRGQRYEDDAWYDVTEWFDGNDYNPTDEAIGRWDDERFSIQDNQSSSDSDNDAETVEANKFYGADYRDSYSWFSDTDGDGKQDTWHQYYDSDGDNLYDGYRFGQLDHTSDRKVPASEVADTTVQGLSGRSEHVMGKISDTKLVKRLGHLSLMVEVMRDEGGKLWVDLGPSNKSLQVFPGDHLRANGPMVKQGKKTVQLATSLFLRGDVVPILRSGFRYQGTIESTRKATVNGQQRTVVKLKTENGKMMTVDMGDTADNKKLKAGERIKVTGVPVKVGDRVVLVADTGRKDRA